MKISLKNITKSKEGFTLIELLVVIAILGVLVAAVLLAINPLVMLKRGRDSQRISDLVNLRKVIDVFMVDSGTSSTQRPTVPGWTTDATPVVRRSDLSAVNICGALEIYRQDAVIGGWMVPCGGPSQPACNICDSSSPGAFSMSAYIPKMPLDPSRSAVPLGNDQYYYLYETNASGTAYRLTAIREATSELFITGTMP